MRTKHSEFGLASCAWTGLVLLWFLYWGVRTGVPAANQSGGSVLYYVWRNFYSFLFVMSHLYFRVQVANLLGIGLAAIGLLQPRRKRFFAVVGLALNLAMLIWAM